MPRHRIWLALVPWLAWGGMTCAQTAIYESLTDQPPPPPSMNRQTPAGQERTYSVPITTPQDIRAPQSQSNSIQSSPYELIDPPRIVTPDEAMFRPGTQGLPESSGQILPGVGSEYVLPSPQTALYSQSTAPTYIEGGDSYCTSRHCAGRHCASSQCAGSCSAVNQCAGSCCAGSDYPAGLFYAGAEAVFAKPHFKEAFSYSATDLQTGQQSLVPFDYDYTVTPRVWVGISTADRTGLEANYWKFEGDGAGAAQLAGNGNLYGAHATTVIFPANIFAVAPGQQLTTRDALDTEVINVYGTYRFCAGTLSVTGGAGMRYANYDQFYEATVSGGVEAPSAILVWSRQFNGLGPSAFFQGRKRIGCSRFYGYARGGGALLFGSKTVQRTVLGDQSPQPAAPFLSLSEADEVVGVGELSMGLECAAELFNGDQLLFRGGYEGQLWAEGGAPTLGFLGFEGFAAGFELRH